MAPHVLLVAFGLCIGGSWCSFLGSICSSISANGYKPEEEDSLNDTLKGLFSAFSSMCWGLCIHICVTMVVMGYLKVRTGDLS